MKKMTKENLKIVFLGTPDFAVESLRRLYDENFNIVGVVTMPDKPAGRGHKMLQSPVKKFALENGLKLLQPVNLKDENFVNELRALNADLFIVIAFRMLPKVVWQMPPLGTFNLHASLLPRYRGAAPINWAIINGDTETGVTTFFLKHEIDTGDIIQQERIPILPEDNVGSIHDKLMMLGADLTIDTVNHIIADDLKPLPQESLLDQIEPTPAPKIFKDTCRIDWAKPASEIHNLIRGLSPYPAAWTTLTDGDTSTTLKIFKSKILPADSLPAGSVTNANGHLIVSTGDGCLEIISLQPQGKKPMAAADFLRGARLSNPLMI